MLQCAWWCAQDRFGRIAASHYCKFVRSSVARIDVSGRYIAGAKSPRAEIYNRVHRRSVVNIGKRDRTRRGDGDAMLGLMLRRATTDTAVKLDYTMPNVTGESWRPARYSCRAIALPLCVEQICQNYTQVERRVCLLWPPYGIGQAIIFLPCGFFYLSFFLSSPNLSCRRLDACRTSIRGVALVRI